MKNMFVIDLFAGCGGLSLGFLQEGFNVKLANDIEDSFSSALLLFITFVRSTKDTLPFLFWQRKRVTATVTTASSKIFSPKSRICFKL